MANPAARKRRTVSIAAATGEGRAIPKGWYRVIPSLRADGVAIHRRAFRAGVERRRSPWRIAASATPVAGVDARATRCPLGPPARQAGAGHRDEVNRAGVRRGLSCRAPAIG